MSKNEAILSAFRITGIKTNDFRLTDTTGRILFCKTFYENERVAGSFFSCIYDGKLRIHSDLNIETGIFNNEIAELIRNSMELAGTSSGMIWVRTNKKSLTVYLAEHFELTPDPEEFFYYSSEFIMPRSKFNKAFDCSLLTVKPYEESCIDSYLSVLADSMSFFIPPQDFFLDKPQYLKDFSDLRDKNAFEAFWKDDELVGLYWIDGIEVDTMGVSSSYQRLGYGAAILTKAIGRVFLQNPEAEHALLYCVGWNAKAQNFYRKYGMELKEVYKVPYERVNG